MAWYDMVLSRRFMERVVVNTTSISLAIAGMFLEQSGFQISKTYSTLPSLPEASWNPRKKTNVASPSPMRC